MNPLHTAATKTAEMTRTADSSATDKRALIAHALPMFLFVALLSICGLLRRPGGSLWLSAPEFWVYPLQTFLCAALLVFYWREYEFHPLRRPIFAISIALLVFVLWIAPQQFFHFPARIVGFNPDALVSNPPAYWTTIILRFVRLVIVVPLVEEIFWRGFLLRYLISERFEAVPFGTFSWLSFSVVTLAFGLSHSSPDWPAALLTGALYNLVAYRTKSLSACVLAHALTNLALGLWIVATRQWGFW
ncbi:MAG TPA: CAAX prenyl protease-related protein [Chthoniobacterales bacterium]